MPAAASAGHWWGWVLPAPLAGVPTEGVRFPRYANDGRWVSDRACRQLSRRPRPPAGRHLHPPRPPLPCPRTVRLRLGLDSASCQRPTGWVERSLAGGSDRLTVPVPAPASGDHRSGVGRVRGRCQHLPCQDDPCLGANPLPPARAPGFRLIKPPNCIPRLI